MSSPGRTRAPPTNLLLAPLSPLGLLGHGLPNACEELSEQEVPQGRSFKTPSRRRSALGEGCPGCGGAGQRGSGGLKETWILLAPGQPCNLGEDGYGHYSLCLALR